MDPNAEPAAPPAEPAAPAAPPAEPAAPAAPADPSAPKVVDSGPAPSLEQVHQANIEKIDGEPAEPVAPEEPPAPEPVAPAEPAEPEEPEDLPGPPVTPPAPEAPVAPNTDTSQPGEGKVAVRSFDGKTYYFNNVNEMPDDFEFASNVEAIKAGQALSEKATKDAADAAQAVEAKNKADADAATKAGAAELNKNWDTTIKAMTASGVLPADDAKRTEVTAEVFKYMNGKLQKGIVLDNFEEAYKAVQYDKMLAKQAEEQKKLDDNKKNAGSMVQPGGAPEGVKPKVVDAPPPGVGLDAVHQKYTTQIG